MGALEAFGELPERCARAAEAGCDLLLVCRRIQAYPECVETVERLVPRFRRDEAARRIQAYAAHLDELRRVAGPPLMSLEAVRAELRALSEA
jgi:beta-glucosidase-like glycosyl hydrolase